MKALIQITIPDTYVEQIQRRVDFCDWLKGHVKNSIGLSNMTIEVSLQKPKGAEKEKKRDRHSIHEMIEQKDRQRAEALKAKKEGSHAR